MTPEPYEGDRAPRSTVRPVERREPQQAERAFKTAEGGSITEALCGLGGVVLAILGLAGAAPRFMIPITSIVIGAGLLAQGGSIAARFSQLLGDASERGWVGSEQRGGVAAETVGGLAGIVLGVLGLVG